MRIIQIIDSLEVGGAERMAINYANSLAKKVTFSGLVATRKEGNLKSQIDNKVNYLFLNKKRAVDLSAVFKLKSYCKKYQVEYIHSHGTSYFNAFLLKLVYPKIKIIWHDHNGERSNQQLKQNKSLWFCSKFFSGIVVVNHALENWCIHNLNFKEVLYLPNFTLFSNSENKVTFLKGESGKRVLCLANLRHPKNHSLLLEVAIKIKKEYPDWTFHLVGNDLEDAYSGQLKETIRINNLKESVYIYGLKNDTDHIIQQATICVLTSVSEGLPVALLEYGLYKKPVVSTRVGEIPLIVKDGENGFIVPSNDVGLFYNALEKLIIDSNLRDSLGESLYKTVSENNSENAVINQYLDWINKL
jgi:glycosyltransferase involved in cell wall biosynthesis